MNDHTLYTILPIYAFKAISMAHLHGRFHNVPNPIDPDTVFHHTLNHVFDKFLVDHPEVLTPLLYIIPFMALPTSMR